MIVLKFLLFPGMATLACKKDIDSRLKWMLQPDFISKNKTFPNAVTGLWNSKWVLCIDLWSEGWCAFKATAETESSTFRRMIQGVLSLLVGPVPSSEAQRKQTQPSCTSAREDSVRRGHSQGRTQPGTPSIKQDIDLHQVL